MNYRTIDRESYYRKGVFRHFSEDCKCSTSMTARIDVTDLVEYSQKTKTKFYINFLYILTKVMNSREDYRMGYLWQTEELVCYDVINPTQYIFHDDTETFTLVYTEYCADYAAFYSNALQDVEQAKKTREYGLDMEHHAHCQLGKISQGKRKAVNAGDRTPESCDRRWVFSCQCVSSAAAGNGIVCTARVVK